MSWISHMNALGAARKPFFFLISFDKSRGEVYAADELPQGLRFKIRAHRHEGHDGVTIAPLQHFTKDPIDFATYKQRYQTVFDRIHYGDSYLVNLTFPTPITTNLTLREIYAHAHAKYKLLLPDQLVVFSPECFVRIEEDHIYSYPMKGTIDASIPDAQNQLLNDEKEVSEHYTIVDLIRNDLSQVATKVRLTKFREIDTIHTHHQTLLQTSSEIRGKLSSDYHHHLGDIFNTLLPAGSISGAPKKETLDIIANAEIDNRDYYTGVFGYYDGHHLDSAVAIRYIESTPNGLVYRSGGGITAMSDAQSEYQEMIQKVYVPLG